MIRIARVMPFFEYVSMQDAAIAKGWYSNDERMFLPDNEFLQRN